MSMLMLLFGLSIISISTAQSLFTISYQKTGCLNDACSQLCDLGVQDCSGVIPICEFGYFLFNNTYCVLCPQQNLGLTFYCMDCVENPSSWNAIRQCSYDYDIFNGNYASGTYMRKERTITNLYYVQLSYTQSKCYEQKCYYLNYYQMNVKYQVSECIGCLIFCSVQSNECNLLTNLNQIDTVIGVICNDGYYFNENICKQCPQNCDSCSDSGICQSCHIGFALDQNQVCQQCFANCLDCVFIDYQMYCLKCKGICLTSHIQYELKCITKQLFKDMNKKCPHCQKISQVIRKEGHSKFFLIEKSGEEKKAKNQYMNPLEITEHIRMLWHFDHDLLKYVYGSLYIDENTLQVGKGYELKTISPQNFFNEVLVVTANRFRPENKVNEQTFLHGHTLTYTNILELNQELRVMITNVQESQPQQQQQPQQQLPQANNTQLKRIVKLENVFQKWLELQDAVIGLFNSEKAQNKTNRETPGVKQLLERKQGLFRMKMMGKRVNYACRSVISPDPLLSTNEVGVPLVLARKLIIPEYVNHLNQTYVAELIMNGPQQYPGALFFQDSDGKKISLEFLTPQQRMGIVRELGSGEGKIVYRQLRTGDVMLFNRQPSLHKPSIMGHIVRILPNEQTIRFHYANCKSYNADFDGDEMNLHFVQSSIARAEGYNIALNDCQYISATNGKPLRELMQDMIISAVFLTLRDTFLTKDIYQQLLYVSVQSLFANNSKKITFMQPAILKPKHLWTGKQLISSLMKIIVELNGYDQNIGLNFEAKAKVSKSELPGHASDDTMVIVRDNELLLGVIDKNQVGSGADFGLVHAFHELYGPLMTGQLLTGMARLFAAYLQMHGFTCGMDDLLVDPQFDKERKIMIQNNLKVGMETAAQYCGFTGKIPEPLDLLNRPEFLRDENGKFTLGERSYLPQGHKLVKSMEKTLLNDKHAEEALDSEYRKSMSKNTSEIVAKTLIGLQKSFPKNLFSCMTLTGAKGSTVNHSQVSVMLGQQELEGRRVPLMPTGRSLPSFIPYDPNPRAGGYVADRFLTGLRPQEFYFHCMAGREGLIDTAVKTSRSGYLQRCLVKHLEGLIVNYDLSVRDSDGSLIQLFYGEDGIDIMRTKYLEKNGFLVQNRKHYQAQYKVAQMKAVMQPIEEAIPDNDTLMNINSPTTHFGSVSMRVNQSLKEEDLQVQDLARYRYLRSLVHPGEAVGCIAGQSIGEPSTQMTLNTFHLAGHGEKNVTLGIPRLREILMTATKKQKTPTMTLQFLDPNIQKVQADRYARRMSRLVLLELVSQIKVTEYKRLHKDGVALPSHQRGVIYEVQISLEDLLTVKYVFGITETQLREKITKIFLPLLSKLIQSELNKNSHRFNEKALVKNTETQKKKKDSEDEEDGEDEFEDDIDESLAKDLTDISMNHDINISQTQDYDIFGEMDQSRAVPTPIRVKKPTMAAQAVQKYLEDAQLNGDTLDLKLLLPLNSKKILMANLVKKTLSNSVLNEIKGISKAKIIKDQKLGYQIYTDGVNLHALRNFDFIKFNNIDCNDIVAIMSTFGIEAARNAIIKEILAVFGAYGVQVDYRHLYLIADYMTFGGQIRAMNRIWMDFNTSPLGKMSFETSTQFLTNACINRETDYLTNLSSQLVLGKVPKVGSNMCDILYKYTDEEQ